MTISATLKAKHLNSVVPYHSSYGNYVEIDVADFDITDAVTADEIVTEYGVDSILNAIDTDDVIKWLEGQGFIISED